MYKLTKYKKSLKITIIVLMAFLVIVPLSGIIFDVADRLLNYDYFKSQAGQPSQYGIDQLFGWMFVAFTNWYALYCTLYVIYFLSRLGFKNEKSEFEKYFFNIISLTTYSIVVALIFWPEIFKQLLVGEGFIFTNSWMKNIITINIHLIAPAIVFGLIGILSYYETIDFKTYLVKYSYYVLLLPLGWLIYSWSRLAIYVNVHGYSPDFGTIVWWDSYKILNPFINPSLAIGLVCLGVPLVYGIALALAPLSLLSKKVKTKHFKKYSLEESQ